MKAPLYQTWVTNFEGARAPIGPAMIEDACNMLCDAIRLQISIGREKDFRDPEVLRVFSLKGS
jgi:hypothetical protein